MPWLHLSGQAWGIALPWWGGAGGPVEFDVVALSLDGKELLVGECKWTSRPVGTNILDELKRKTHVLMTGDKGAGATWGRVQYAIFARSGFTPALEALAGEEGTLLAGPDDLLDAHAPT